MRKISILGLLLISATLAGCLYPALKLGDGGTDAPGGTTDSGTGADGKADAGAADSPAPGADGPDAGDF